MLDRYLDWLTNVELAGRPDAARVAADLGRIARRIARRAGELAGRRAIDIGTGTGPVAAAVADLGAAVVGIDVDRAALARGPDATRTVAADARALPFADRVFHASVHRSILVSMEDREAVVAEERRVLVSGARVSASESLAGDIAMRAREEGLERVWEAGLGPILHAGGALALSARELEALYRGGGFTEVHVEPVPIEVVLDSSDAVARAFTVRPPVGEPPATAWRAAGIPDEIIQEFLARLVAEAERGRPVRLVAAEGFLTAQKP